MKLALASLGYLQENYAQERAENEHLDNLVSNLELDLKAYERGLAEPDSAWQASQKEYRTMYLGMLKKRRELLNALNNHAEFDEQLIRKHLALVDVEELRAREKSL